MKLAVLNQSKTETRKMELPVQFSEPIRKDLIKRAVLAIRANTRQPYGADPMAGKRASAEISRRRKDYRGAYGIGISRVPRKIMSRRGTRMNWVGAFAPGTVKGRRAHPPKAEKLWGQKINTKERRKAIRSALGACMVKELVEQRGHRLPQGYPFLLDSEFEGIGKTKQVVAALVKLGLAEELERVKQRKVRAGKGKMRGRRYSTKTGPIIVVAEKCRLMESGRNLTGVDIVPVNRLNAQLLAPGISIGRLALFTDKAMERMAKERLFAD